MAALPARFQLLLLLAASCASRTTAAAGPLCSTCADWCAGTCDSFRRPPKTTVNADGTETITLYRMTPQARARPAPLSGHCHCHVVYLVWLWRWAVLGS